MNTVLLSRIQFAVTVGFDFIFAPLTIGLSWLIVRFMWKHWKTSDALHTDLAQP